MPAGKIKEALESHELSVGEAVKDIVFVAGSLYEAGADGINIDSVGAAGDADFLAALLATEQLKAKYPEICIEMGMAGEFILGMHGGLEYKGVRLAGLYGPQQVELAQKAGVTIFGPVVNTNTSETVAWNVAPGRHIHKGRGQSGPNTHPSQHGHGGRCRPGQRSSAGGYGLPSLQGHGGDLSTGRVVGGRRAILLPWLLRMHTLRAWAVCGLPEIWWPGCK